MSRLHQSALQIVGRSVLSLVTKFLWLKEKSPVRIHDSLARTALEVPEVDDKGGQYGRFRDAWNLEYSKAEQVIRRACLDLEAIGRFSCDPEAAASDYLRDLTAQTWFQHRVFDVYLWRKGGLQKAT